ncbi:MAG TPA: HAD domain-containing protein [Vicinamibacterales bacterium]|nr:HAD domain-containing protein [Vicinamibacterales bacterium]
MSSAIFLDFDGVLNNSPYLYRPKRALGRLHKAIEKLDPANVAVLNTLVERSDAPVVVHSTWRYSLEAREIQIVLDGAGFGGEVAGVLPRDMSDCGGVVDPDDIGAMLLRWLRARQRIRHCVVLEDSRIWGVMSEHQVRPSADTGLLPEHVEQALAILRREGTW